MTRPALTRLGRPVSVPALGIALLGLASGCENAVGTGSTDGFTGAGSFTGEPTTSATAGDDTSNGPCQADEDCFGDPGGPVCVGGQCVECSPTQNFCGDGFHCSADLTCEPGCGSNKDCTGDDICDTTTNECVGCIDDDSCDAGFLCDAATSECVPGCDDDSPCPDPEACCSGQCFDIATDPTHCGSCDGADAMCMFTNAEPTCDMGVCVLDPNKCDSGFFDCNGDSADGCESTTMCTCTPGSTQGCYSGPAGTAGVGKCVEGSQTCEADGLAWSACTGEVLPDATEVCGDMVDNDCDGIEDDSADPDNDGYSLCDGMGNILDCCEDSSCASAPEKVSPGAYDFPGDMIDQDCDGMDSMGATACDDMLPVTPTALDYAKALDMCATTPAAGPGYGAVTVTFNLANGVGTPSADAHAIRSGFGTNLAPQFGSNMVVLSTGKADPSQDAEPGFDQGISSGTPLGVSPMVPAGCGAPSGTVYDSIQMALQFRMPPNAEAFSFDAYYLTADYPERICTEEVDFFYALSNSSAMNNPSDGNIAIYDGGTTTYQVSANLTKANLFEDCDNADTEQCANGNGVVAYAGCTANTNLVGTGFDGVDTIPSACKPAYTGANGAGTGWMRVAGNANGGELVTLRFVIFDAEVATSDSTVLLDNFQWIESPTTAGITPL